MLASEFPFVIKQDEILFGNLDLGPAGGKISVADNFLFHTANNSLPIFVFSDDGLTDNPRHA